MKWQQVENGENFKLAILFGLRKVGFETICEYIEQFKFKFWSQMQKYFKCLNQLVMAGFFFLFFVRGLILKTKP